MLYIRTDVGGAYRWDKPNNKWIQLCDMFTAEQENFYGIDGIAVDPQNSDIVYIAAGKYPWADGDVLKSTDRGETWERMGLNKKFQANGSHARGYGECIAVDPVNSSIIYCGTAREGLWSSGDSGLKWEQVRGGIETTKPVRNVVFDRNSANSGKCQTIYAGVDKEGVYRSIDGGNGWELLEGTPLSVKRMEVGYSGALYVASTTGLFKFADGVWKEISPAEHKGKMFNGVSLHPEDENTIITVAHTGNTMKMPFFLTEDGGETWVNKWETADFQPTLPWMQYGSGGDFSSNTHDIKINPHDPKQVFLTDWLGIYVTDDISAQPKQRWTNPVVGIEEIVPRDAISPPVGKYRLIVGVADTDGFPYEDVTKYPQRLIREDRDHPWMMSTSQIDFCVEEPNIILRVGVDWNVHGKAEYSLDGSETWNNITNIPYYVDSEGKKTFVPFGRAAVSAQKHPDTGKPVFLAVSAYNPNSTNVLPPGVKTLPQISFDYGETWQEVKGFPEGTNIISDYWQKHTPLASDRVNGARFYACTAKAVYVSEDWGANWTQTAEIAGFDTKNIIRAVPEMEGHVWVGVEKSWAGGSDGALYTSSDGGKTFDKKSNVTHIAGLGFGKEAPGSTNPTAYIFGTLDGEDGMYRSTDMGVSWEKITNNKNPLGNMHGFIVGDSRVFGVVYASSDGRGIYFGKPKGTVMETASEPAAVFDGVTRMYYNGELMSFVNQPVVKNGVQMVPIREFFEYFGAQLEWSSEERSVTVRRKELIVTTVGRMASGDTRELEAVFTLDGTLRVNGSEKSLEEDPFIINDIMYVPLTSAAQAFGAETKFDQDILQWIIEDEALILL